MNNPQHFELINARPRAAWPAPADQLIVTLAAFTMSAKVFRLLRI